MSAGAVTALPARAAGLSRTTRLFHWSVALGILAMLVYGFWLQWLPDGPDRGAAVRTHKSIGLLLLVLVLCRALWRRHEGFPTPTGPHRPWERRAARAMHGALIAASLLMPVTGILRSVTYGRPVALFGVSVIPQVFATKHEGLYAVAAGLHNGLAFLLCGLVALHLAAALKHHLIDGDDTLRRMVGVRR